MKLSVTLPREYVAFLDAYAGSNALSSRSEALRQAVAALRDEALRNGYSAAHAEWAGSADAACWEACAGDNL
jgi:Arc/MetJ-type ribon-helix-helix transcriptional regulator